MKIKQLFDRDKMYIYPFYIADLVATMNMKEIAGLNVEKILLFNKEGYIRWFVDVDSAGKIGENILEKLVNNRDFFNKVIDRIYNESDNLMLFCEKIKSAKCGDLSNIEIVDLYREYIERMRNLRKWGWIPVFVDGCENNFLTDHISSKFKDFLIGRGRADKFNEYYAILSSSDKKSCVMEEEFARFELLENILELADSEDIIETIKNNEYQNFYEKYPKAGAFVKKHLKEFGWLTYAYSGPVMQIDYLFKLLKDDIEKEYIKGEKEKIKNYSANIKAKKAKIIKELDMPEELIHLFNISAEFMFIKDYRKGIYQKSYVVMDKVMGELASRLGFSLKEVKYLVFNEIKEAVLDKKADFYKRKLEGRLKRCCYSVENGGICVYEGEDCDKIEKEVVEKDKENKQVNTLKGMTAYPGKVRGIVKIVLVVEDIPKVNEGDILVSSATNPDLILAMKKAASFVTDTGGIISHAAIVSREMKKPCIVGTRIATKVLKDGDEVEVDAGQGIVKKIN